MNILTKTFLTSLSLLSSVTFADTANWADWRGGTDNGVVTDQTPPTTWSNDQNIKWKAKIPGSGLAVPIIWEDKIFLLTSIPAEEAKTLEVATPAMTREEAVKFYDKNKDGKLSSAERAEMRKGTSQSAASLSDVPADSQAFTVMALDRSTGATIWQKTARLEVPHEGHHPTHGYASSSPVTDGEYLYVPFGSRGFYCYDFDGNLIWETNLGQMRTRAGFGEASSPILIGNKLIVLWDHEGDSFITALDKTNGKEIWKTARSEPTSWTTPKAVTRNGMTQIIVPGDGNTRSYNADTGESIWNAAGLTMNIIPIPLVADDTVYVMSGYRGRSIQSIDLNSKGDVTDSLNWSVDHSAAYVASPVLYGDRLYVSKGIDAILACLNANTGATHYRDQPLEGMRGIYASLTAANGNLYVFGREGTAMVIKDSDTFEVVSTNKLDDQFDSSPAFVDNEIYVRGHEYLYCISEQ